MSADVAEPTEAVDSLAVARARRARWIGRAREANQRLVDATRDCLRLQRDLNAARRETARLRGELALARETIERLTARPEAPPTHPSVWASWPVADGALQQTLQQAAGRTDGASA